MLDSDIKYLEQNLTFWKNLTDIQKDKILKNTTNINYKKNQNVHSPDKECLGVIIVKKGELRAYLLSEDGKEVTLFRLCEGDICVLSSACMFNDLSFDVYLNCEKTTSALIINSIVFSELTKGNVYVENFALKNMADKFSKVLWTIEQFIFTKFDKRLATFLLEESQRLNNFKIKLTHEQIAKYLGTAREVVSRMLKYFEQEKIVTLFRGGIDIIDLEKLKKFV